MSESPRILIADESRMVRAAFAQKVRDHFEVREAIDGEAAWQAMLLDGSIRAVVTGLALPKVDGIELIARARASKVRRIREMPLVVVCDDDEPLERERASAAGASEFVPSDIDAAELNSRLDVVVRMATPRETPADGQPAAEPARNIDPDTNLLVLAHFDRQVEKLVSYSRRNVTDVAILGVVVDLTTAQPQSWTGETEQRLRLIGRSLASAIRLEDLATRAGPNEFCIATQSDGVANVLRFAARLRKILENGEAAGNGVEVWTSIGVSCLSEDMRLTAEQLRQISQKRAQQAQASRTRRIVLGAGEAGGSEPSARAEEGSMDVNLALTLIRSGRGAEVVPHLPRLMHQLRPLMALVREQKERALSNEETVVHGNLQGVQRTIDQ